jgi:exonuclease III
MRKHLALWATRGYIPKRYTVHNSNTPTGNGGVTMLLDRKYFRVGAATQQTVPAECKGCLIRMTVGMPYTATLHILGVYMPCDNMHARMKPVVYQHYLTTLLQLLPDADTAILAGDWNAVLWNFIVNTTQWYPYVELKSGSSIVPRTALCYVKATLDSTCLTSADTRHVAWVQSQPRLQSVYTTMNNRQPTFFVIVMRDSPSMIDDMLLPPPTGVGSTAAVHAAEIQQVHGHNTDHAL